MKQDVVVKAIVSAAALGLMLVRFAVPDLKIDSVSIGLFVVAILPWASAFVQRLKGPGDWEIEFRRELERMDDKVEKIIDSSSEGPDAPADAVPSPPVALSDRERKVLQALTQANVPLRSRFGITRDTGLNTPDVEVSLQKLVDNGLAARVEGKKGIRWGISPEGRRYLGQS